MKSLRRSYLLTSFCFLVFVFLLSSCAKKVVKEDTGGTRAISEETFGSEEGSVSAKRGEADRGELKEEVIAGEEVGKMPGSSVKEDKIDVSKAIEEALGELKEETEEGGKPLTPESQIAGKMGESKGGIESGTIPMEKVPGFERGITPEGERSGGLVEGSSPGLGLGVTPEGGSIEGGGNTFEEKTSEEQLALLQKVDKIVNDEKKLLPIYFDFDKYSIRKDAIDTLSANAAWLKRHPEVKAILVEGHADERGSNEYNLALGDRRARSVMEYLGSLGVNVMISTVSYGEERPVCRESNETCWSKNRRAEFKIVSK